MPIVYLLSDNSSALRPVGVFATEDSAKIAAGSGNYLLTPITVGTIYPSIIDDTLPGSYYFDSMVADIDARFKQFKQAAQNQLQRINTRLNALEAFHTTST